MKKKYSITIEDFVNYDIEADSEEKAIEIALDYWVERDPTVYVESKEEVE